jgi:hypothetical protein
MALSGLHLLMTYQCTFECDHCFVWGSPSQTGTMTLSQVRELLNQGEELGTIQSIAFEGGEAFMYYATLLESILMVKERGWRASIVTNAYWATSLEDAMAALRPLVEAGLNGIYVSDDAYHGSLEEGSPPALAVRAAQKLGLATNTIAIASAEDSAPGTSGEKGQPITGGAVMFRGRAAAQLVPGLPRRPWHDLVTCPHEDLAHPSRVHIDPLGHVHLCQGLTIGNTSGAPLIDIMTHYDPKTHPIVGPLLEGGPAALARAFEVPHEEAYVDECHLCYDLRDLLRRQQTQWLGPDQMYGVPKE